MVDNNDDVVVQGAIGVSMLISEENADGCHTAGLSFLMYIVQNIVFV